MAITYTNNWKNILNKLTNILKVEFTFPIITGKQTNNKNRYIRIIPEGSTLTELASFSEQREFNITIQYIAQRRKQDDVFIEYITRMASRIEALIHDNLIMTLADNTIAFDCHLATQEFDFEDEEMEDWYIIQWDYNCSHVGNTA